MSNKSETSAGFGAWEEWRYRHEFFWAATTRWLLAVLAIAGLPYSSEQLRSAFGWLTIVFPIFACLIGAVAFVHLLAEHARPLYVRWLVSYREKEDEFLADTTLPSRAHQWLRRPIRWRIAPYIFVFWHWAYSASLVLICSCLGRSLRRNYRYLSQFAGREL